MLIQRLHYSKSWKNLIFFLHLIVCLSPYIQAGFFWFDKILSNEPFSVKNWTNFESTKNSVSSWEIWNWKNFQFLAGKKKFTVYFTNSENLARLHSGQKRKGPQTRRGGGGVGVEPEPQIAHHRAKMASRKIREHTNLVF